jgi:hypothetical protein
MTKARSAQEDNHMAKTILVALNSKTKIDMLLPRLERLAKSGDGIVFLVRYEKDITATLLAQTALIQTGLDTAVTCEDRRTRALWEEHKNRLERDIAVPARRVFNRLDVDVDVNIYSGSLNRIINRYLENSDVTLFVGASAWLRRLNIVSRSVRNWLVSRGRYDRSVLLMHSEDRFIERQACNR